MMMMADADDDEEVSELSRYNLLQKKNFVSKRPVDTRFAVRIRFILPSL